MANVPTLNADLGVLLAFDRDACKPKRPVDDCFGWNRPLGRRHPVRLPSAGAPRWVLTGELEVLLLPFAEIDRELIEWDSFRLGASCLEFLHANAKERLVVDRHVARKRVGFRD